MSGANQELLAYNLGHEFPLKQKGQLNFQTLGVNFDRSCRRVDEPVQQSC